MHTKNVKATLSDKQRLDRVGFVLSHLHRRGGSGVFVDDMFHWVHADKKRCYLTKDRKKAYLQPDEEVPKPPRASCKRFVLNMMFLAAVAHPRKLANGVWFNGKIAIWPIVDVVTAQRASKSRARGDPVLRQVTVDGENFKEIMIDEVIPAFKARMP
ncbi:unnamed protein product [Discosporangium mesarthrocarpum]